MPGLRFYLIISCLLSCLQQAQAQKPKPVDWPMLADPAAQQFEDPYRDLTKPQFQSLMKLAQLQIVLDNELPAGERADLEGRAEGISSNLRAQGLDPQWILSQREVVAERRQRAALETNSELDGKHIELTGYLLVASEVEDGAMVAYLLLDRGVCMHLPPPAPNQLVRLDIEQLPEPLGPCIAAAVRGRLYTNETTTKVPVFDDTIPLWSRWRLDVGEMITSGAFPPDNGPSHME